MSIYFTLFDCTGSEKDVENAFYNLTKREDKISSEHLENLYYNSFKDEDEEVLPEDDGAVITCLHETPFKDCFYLNEENVPIVEMFKKFNILRLNIMCKDLENNIYEYYRFENGKLTISGNNCTAEDMENVEDTEMMMGYKCMDFVFMLSVMHIKNGR